MPAKLQDTLPLARAYAVRELPGWWGKSLDVPPGKIGVAVDARGQARTWPKPGRHRVLSVSERLRGQGIGLRAGWVPAEPFEAAVQVPYLLSGEGRLVNLSLVARVRVSDPVAFFTRQVAPAGVLHHVTLSLNAEEAQAALSAVTTQYLADDLARGVPGEGLQAALVQRLRPFLATEGLAIQAAPVVFFWDPEKRASIEEKVLALEERLHNLQIEGKIAAAEAQERLEAFLREMEADGVKVQVTPLDASEAASPEEAQDVLAAVRALWQGKEVRHPLLKRLFEQNKESTLPAPRLSRWWWVPRTAFIVAAWTIALLVTRLIFWWRGNNSFWDSWDLLTPLWGFVLGVTLEGIKALYEKRERAEEANWQKYGYTRVDDLARQDRARADRLVREQSASMLRSLAEALNGWRSRVFRQGNTDLALRLKTLEKEAEHLAEDVLRSDFGRPPYVDPSLRIGKTTWDAMLDYDEALLVELHELLEYVRNLQSPDKATPSQEKALASLEQKLADFRLMFSRRSEALRPQQDGEK
ncbi:MAG: hypothetical protein GXO56_07825 [Chloroflexi bacterium]|nr:hypothetical protein [Chloroflexota bacterium]